jgi:hypothetical protein
VAVSATPAGSFQLPDVTINNNGPANVQIAASGIPPGTIVTLRVYPETPEDQSTVFLATAEGTLNGSLEAATATVPVTFPYGLSRVYLRASWTQ